MELLKKFIAVFASLLALCVGIAGLLPFANSEYNRQVLLSSGSIVDGKLVEIKNVEKNSLPSPGPNEPPKDAHIEPLKAGKISYLVDGKSYDIIRPQLNPNAKIGDVYKVRYEPKSPEQSTFDDTPFPFGFMVASIALFALCVTFAVMILRSTFKKKKDCCGECPSCH